MYTLILTELFTIDKKKISKEKHFDNQSIIYHHTHTYVIFNCNPQIMNIVSTYCSASLTDGLCTDGISASRCFKLSILKFSVFEFSVFSMVKAA